MLYRLNLETIPKIKNYYTVTRNTVWQITDRYNILILIIDGCCEITTDFSTYKLQKNDVFFIPANHSYTRRPINNELCTMLYIHFETASDFLQIETPDAAILLSHQKSELDMAILGGDVAFDFFTEIYIQSKNEIKDAEIFSDFIKDPYVSAEKRHLLHGFTLSYSLCSILTSVAQTTIDAILTDTSVVSITKIPQKLKQAVGYIAQNYSKQITLENLSKHYNVSKQQMIRYFRQTLDTTPLQYITSFKIARAKELLFNHPQLTIKEIADELGFDNQNYFSKVFTKHTGESPTDYRYRTLNYEKLHNMSAETSQPSSADL